jgi:hypothetical protein
VLFFLNGALPHSKKQHTHGSISLFSAAKPPTAQLRLNIFFKIQNPNLNRI